MRATYVYVARDSDTPSEQVLSVVKTISDRGHASNEPADVVLLVRMPPSLRERVAALAGKEARSLSSQIRIMLRYYLDNMGAAR